MPPYSSSVRVVEAENNVADIYLNREKNIDELEYKQTSYFKTDIIWSKTIGIIVMHLITVYALITFPYTQRFGTVLFRKLPEKAATKS